MTPSEEFELSQIRSLTQRLEGLGPNEFLDVRSLPQVVADEFGIDDVKAISVSAKTRDHYIRKHSWLAGNHEEVVRTVMYPRQIVADKVIANRVLFYRQCTGGMEVLVVVEVMTAPGISHKVVTAFEATPEEVARRKPLERVIWTEHA